ncbi:MAG: Gfo/Idh/MocA family oxidoreductase [Gemmatimonadetes bacterium]|nr:Gfo/Idh/MocA family oxidoreductase [Gemmatimonadota bacterium]MYD25170.1 Gfo/Idh/MocA family oxidoreductase [Gemmatimonadota bacterium]MYI99551.1 Gfo/Idh/MocA family oxidoreductase [Gemmatimonadota bacterium]
MGLQVGIVGTGAFSQSFIPLFKAHPHVERVVLCDLDDEKRAVAATRFEIRDTSPSLDDLCASPVDAVCLFTQNWLHGSQAVQALEAGKHVYSAVPPGISVTEIENLVAAARSSGAVYMLGETSYYYPGVLYCREQFARGAFGQIVYGQAEYYHDWDHGLYDVARWRGGENWRDTAGIPPMYYPTHSTSQIISVTGARMTRVSCQGFRDTHEDGIYGANDWANPFSNQSALYSMSDGSVCRINEFRRVGHPGCVRMGLQGTEGGFEQTAAGASWLRKDGTRVEPLDDLLACTGQPVPGSDPMDKVTASDGTHLGVSSAHPVERLPETFAGLPNGHAGSHQFLVDDFVMACVNGTVPPNNAWAAARYMLPGLTAHESALHGGALLEVPDLGDPPGAD